MKKHLLFLIFLSFTGFQILKAQNSWQWGTSASVEGFTYPGISAFDNDNNIYVFIPYGDIITLQDTAFSQSGSFYNLENFVLAKYDINGNLIKALNVTGIPDELVGYHAKVIVDDEFNVYIAVYSRKAIYVGNTFIEPKSEYHCVFLVKLDPEFNVLWQKQIYSEESGSKCIGFDFSEDKCIYLASCNYGNGMDTTTINFFDQDTVRYLYDMIAVTKLNKAGNIIWNRKIFNTHFGHFDFDFGNLGKNGSYYIHGYFEFPLIVEGDTLSLPQGEIGLYDIAYMSNGNLRHALTNTQLNVYPGNLIANKKNNYYFTAYINDTLVFGTDTLRYSLDTTAYLIGEIDTLYQPVWYKIKKIYDNRIGNIYYYDTGNDTLDFISNCLGTFTFDDSIYNVGNKPAILYGRLTQEGELIETSIVKSSDTLFGYSIKTDNCNHQYIAGNFDGMFIIGNDTLVQNNLDYQDVFVAKLNASVLDILPFSDTTILLSTSLTLQVPDIFDHVLWSTGDTTQSITLRGDSLQAGEHILMIEANNNSCIVKDSVKITVIDDSGITDFKDLNIFLYPNPARASITIYSIPEINIRDITLYDQAGRILLRKKGFCRNLDLTKLKSGLYYIRFYANDIEITKKFIKE